MTSRAIWAQYTEIRIKTEHDELEKAVSVAGEQAEVIWGNLKVNLVYAVVYK